MTDKAKRIELPPLPRRGLYEVDIEKVAADTKPKTRRKASAENLGAQAVVGRLSREGTGASGEPRSAACALGDDEPSLADRADDPSAGTKSPGGQNERNRRSSSFRSDLADELLPAVPVVKRGLTVKGLPSTDGNAAGVALINIAHPVGPKVKRVRKAKAVLAVAEKKAKPLAAKKPRGRPVAPKPWEAEGISRMTWYRRQKANGNG